MNDDTTISTESILLRNAAKVAQRAVAALRDSEPEVCAALAGAAKDGRVKFDIRLRDVLGASPCLDVFAVVDGTEALIGTEQLRRADVCHGVAH